MGTNNLFRTVLFGLIFFIAALVTWKFCQMRSDALKQKAATALPATPKTYDYAEQDTSGSSYVDKTPAATTGQYRDGSKEGATKTAMNAPAKASKPAIEGDDSGAGKTAAKPQMHSTPSTAAKGLVASDYDEEKTTTKKKATAKSTAHKSSGGAGRYMVITGSFRDMKGARAGMERLVKEGFRKASALPLLNANRVKYCYAVAIRTNDTNEAAKVLEDARLKGYTDAYIKKAW